MPAVPSSWPTHPWVAAASQTVRFGISGGPRTDWPALLDFVQTAEAVGADSFWTADHPLRDNTPDCWTLLAALAVTTRTIRLGPLVNCIYYRGAAILARQAADVDRMSGGRLVLGLGIGDYAWEFERFCLPMPPVRERQRALTETIEVLRGLWAEQPFTYEGQYVQVKEARVAPAPVQRPHVPLLIAGGGEQVTLRQVARYADMSNFGPSPDVGSAFTLADVRRKYAALRQHCQQVGRPFNSVLRSYWTVPVCAATATALHKRLEAVPPTARGAPTLVAGTPADLIAHYQQLVDAGVRYYTAYIAPGDIETLRLLGEQVIPALIVPPECKGEA